MTLAGEPRTNLEWKGKPLAHLQIRVDRRIDGRIRWTETQNAEGTEDAAIEIEFGDTSSSAVIEVPSVPKSGLVRCCVGTPFHTVDIVKYGTLRGVDHFVAA